MTTATAATDFTLEVTSSGWGHLLHRPCGKWASFLEPTDDRVRWHVAAHRCGPEGTDWHVGGVSADKHRAESPDATAAWLRSVARYVGTRPPELLAEATVWPAVQELAQTLDAMFLAARNGGRSR